MDQQTKNPEPQNSQTSNIVVGGEPPVITAQPQKPEKPGKKWVVIFTVLGIANFLMIVIPWLITISLIRESSTPGSETGLFFLVLLPVYVVGFFVGILNVVLILRYFSKFKPRKKVRIMGWVVIAATAILVLLPGGLILRNNLGLIINPKGTFNNIQKQAVSKFPPETETFQNITPAEATTMINNCQLHGFYYGSENNSDNGGGGNLSPTGVVLTIINGSPYRISIADNLIPTLVPIATAAQKTCPSLQIFNDANNAQ